MLQGREERDREKIRERWPLPTFLNRLIRPVMSR